jgi:hypothetical protein
MADDPKVTTNLDEANEAGYLGSVPDPTPNEAYTVAGVTSSDEAAKADRRAAARQGTVPPDPTVKAETKKAETKSSSDKSA